MNREFLEFYNRELKLLREEAVEFAQEYPGVAERLGGLLSDRVDPMISGLLEGSAFLAARVQLKLKHEFADFTINLIDQLTPQYLAPTPSFLLAEIAPKFGDPALREGRAIPAGAYFEATYREMERNVACRFSLTAPVTLWPFDLVKAEYLIGSAPIQSLAPSLGIEAAAGLRLQFTVRAARPARGRTARRRRRKTFGVLGQPLQDQTSAVPSARAPSRTRSRSTSKCSRIAAASISGGSMRSAIRPASGRTPTSSRRSASANRKRWFPTISGCSAASTPCANISPSRASF